MIKPIRNGETDITKGNRFINIEKLSSMPKLRLFGNISLSFLAASTGYWDLFDPTNGLAIHRDALEKINIDKIDNKFFETDLLFRFGLVNAFVIEVPLR